MSENRGVSTSGTGMSSINKVIEGRAATVLQPEQVHTRTEQENDGARNAKNPPI